MVFIHNINPTLFDFTLFGANFEIRYYGMLYMLSFIIAYFMIRYLAKQRKLGITDDDAADLILYILVGVVAGARVFYIVFYNLQYYLQNPLEMVAVWHGGLSFHGGLAGAALAGWYFCRKKKISFYKLADIAVIPAAIGLALGRIGNFLNGEVYGRVTEMPWGVKFPDAEGFRHPSQLYESLKNLAIFATLWKIKDKMLPDGFLFWSFVTMYGLLRFLIEFVKEPDSQLGFFLGYFTMGQLLTFPMFVGGAIMLYRLKRNHENK
ncbi:prolipoprotein diacylglyceryl transferase [Candidatus Woesearchaeota archaeon]|nr:prolipoprotein diacylglyceryl transferase [Candidatus Woesearchaeota archaeon]